MRRTWRFRLAKRGRMRFLSHLDLIRAIARGFRRAGLVLARSEGFHPHPLFSFGPALAVGIESEAEYFDAVFGEEPGPGDELAARINDVLPEGLALREAARPTFNGPSLAAAIDAASYSLRLDGPPEAAEAFLALLDCAELPFERRGREGAGRRIDLRPLLFDVCVPKLRGREVRLLGMVGSKGNLRPEELVFFIEGATVGRILRTGLYHRRDGLLLEPIHGRVMDWKEIGGPEE